LLEDGEWVRSLTVDLKPYDAGTEEGMGFSLANSPSPASDAIFRLTGDDSPFIGRPSLGTLEFTLINPPEPPTPEPPVSPPTPPSGEKNAEALSAIINLLQDD